jgi:hypothetical protein
MVGVTIASVVVSAVVAIVAIWNGRLASRIANNAANRDEENREAERQRRASAERAAVAMQLIEVLESLVVWADTAPGTGNPGTPLAMAEFRKVRSHAYSALEIYPRDTETLRKWFQAELDKIVQLGRQRTSQFEKVDATALVVRQKLARWSRGDWEPGA